MKSRVVNISEIRNHPNMSLSAKDYLVGVDLATGEDNFVEVRVLKNREAKSASFIFNPDTMEIKDN